MRILITNKKTSKTALISNKYTNVILNSYYSLKNSKTINIHNHHFQFIEFIDYFKNKNSLEIELVGSYYLSDKPVDILFFQDISDEDLKLIKKRDKLFKYKPYKIIALCEHPNYQVKDFEKKISNFDEIYSSYDINVNYFKTLSNCIFKQIPLKKVEFNQKDFDISIICSNLYRLSESNYGLRRQIINIFSMIKEFDFKWYGHGWKINKSYTIKKNIKYLISNLLNYPKLSKYTLSSYQGALKSKEILEGCKLYLAIENHNNPKGYLSEKLFESLIYECLPIYVGHKIEDEMVKNIKYKERIFIHDNLIENIISSSIFFNKFSIEETKKISRNIRSSFNNYFKKNNYNTSLYKSAKKIIYKLK